MDGAFAVGHAVTSITTLLAYWLLLSTVESKRTVEDELHRHKARGGESATQEVASSLADRHFDLHGARWPSKAFVVAVNLAAPALTMPSSSLHSRSHRSPLLLALANELALHVTVPIFVR